VSSEGRVVTAGTVGVVGVVVVVVTSPPAISTDSDFSTIDPSGLLNFKVNYN